MIGVEDRDGLRIVTLRRPEKANSLTRAMLHDLEAAIAVPAQAVILTGEGKVFSAGADLDEARAGLATDGVWDRLSERLAALPCLTIAALNGTLAGGAMGMVLACDVRLAVPSAKFFYPVMKLGYLPQPADPARLRALIGPARTKILLMAGARIEAAEALAWGLIDRIVEADHLMAEAEALTADARAAKAGHAAAIKGMI